MRLTMSCSVMAVGIVAELAGLVKRVLGGWQPLELSDSVGCLITRDPQLLAQVWGWRFKLLDPVLEGG